MGFTREEKQVALRAFVSFASLDGADLDALVASVRWRELFDGDVLFRQGDYGDSMVLVALGEFSVRLRRGERETEIRRVRPGEILGEMSCMDPAPRSTTLVAIGPSVVAELSRDALQALRDCAPALSSRIVAMVVRDVSRRLRDIDHRIAVELGEVPPKRDAAAEGAAEGALTSSLRGLLERLRGWL